ncbi:MAG: ABC transporter ATP-binding protein [Clostridiales bacterium]|jgi:energy-coupling factor transport system ATP-binding protein|nr:ABC transporter ATP-binding protein [Clostridiales bacterium]
MIELQGYSFRYNESVDFALKNINMKIETGEFLIITGRSGCGKTTLIRTLNGLIPHFYPGEIKGDILLDGRSLLEAKPSELAGKIGTVFQDPRSQFFMTDTTRELAFGCENLGCKRDETIERVVNAVEDLELAQFLNRSIFKLSSGEKQQVAIGSVYALSPKVYIFDEPSANLDYYATKRLAEIMTQLKRSGYTVIVAEHRFYYLHDLFDRVYLIQDGRLDKTFTREQFCNLHNDIRIQYGLRTVYPEREIQVINRSYNRQPKPNNCLEVNNLSFAYKRGQAVFSGLGFLAQSGDVVGILGNNGTGKTTLLSILTGIMKQQSGSISYNGKPLSQKKRRRLSYLVMQDADYQLFGSSVEEELTLGIETDCSVKVADTLDALELSAYKERHPASLSGGQKQRVTIGAAIIKGSPVIYFDEPTSGLDNDSMIRVSGMIKSLSDSGLIIFVVSHDMEFIARTCTQVLQMDNDTIQNEHLSKEVLERLIKQYFA